MDRTALISTNINTDDTTISVFCNPILPNNSGKITLALLKQNFPELFYPQDWFDKEPFMNESFDSGWYKISKNIIDSSKGVTPIGQQLYPASLITYVFISYYMLNKEILWPHDYIWCDTYDSSGDQIYVGRYFDPLNLSKPGFSIHRHLSIKKNYGWV